jgi:methionyl-tRNA synthetase
MTDDHRSAPNAAVASTTEDASSAVPYDRWTLRDPSNVSYGYFSGVGNSIGGNYPAGGTTRPPSSSSSSTSGTVAMDDMDGTTGSEEQKGFYLTTAINYTNGPAHMGHAYEGATSDAIARYARLANRPTTMEGMAMVDSMPYFVTGADEHGEKIAKTAEAEGKEPIDICDKVRLLFISFRRTCFRCFPIFYSSRRKERDYLSGGNNDAFNVTGRRKGSGFS